MKHTIAALKINWPSFIISESCSLPCRVVGGRLGNPAKEIKKRVLKGSEGERRCEGEEAGRVEFMEFNAEAQRHRVRRGCYGFNYKER